MRRRRHGLLLLLFLAAGCGRPVANTASEPLASPATVIDARQADAQPQLTRHPVRFRDVTRSAGLNYRYHNGATGCHLFVETTGGGVALLDANNDGWLDLFAVQGGPVPGAAGAERQFPRRNALYLARGGTAAQPWSGTYRDVTVAWGLAEPAGYGQGVAAADYDNDGWTDLYVTAYGGNRLFRNTGRSRFVDVTRAAGVADREPTRPGHGAPWPLSAAWGDFNNDGRLDLFVCHYVRWTRAGDRPCPLADGRLAYCRPQVYEGSVSRLYQNEGGRFRDVTRRSGIGRLAGKSMGASWLDADDDGWLDLFVSNDTTPNFLLRNNRDGTFTDRALAAGVAVGPSGEPLSGMGIGVTDYDGNGRADLFVVNFAGQPKTLWANVGDRFEDRSYASHLASSDLQFLGFGLECLDYDLDGRPDLVVGNGHVLDNAEVVSPGATYRQSQQLFRNRGNGTFAEDRRSLGDLATPRVTRGLAIGDMDNDGDADVALGTQNGPLDLLLNDGGNRAHWITFRLEGSRGARDAIGARLTIETEGGRRTGWVLGGSSYCAQSDRRVTFGLGEESAIRRLTLRWPGGRTQRFGPLLADRFYLVREGQAPRPDPRIPIPAP